MFSSITCNIKNHGQRQIDMFCVNKDCTYQPTMCSICFKDMHRDHAEDCIEFEVMQEMKKEYQQKLPQLTDQIKHMMKSLQSLIHQFQQLLDDQTQLFNNDEWGLALWSKFVQWKRDDKLLDGRFQSIIKNAESKIDRIHQQLSGSQNVQKLPQTKFSFIREVNKDVQISENGLILNYTGDYRMFKLEPTFEVVTDQKAYIGIKFLEVPKIIDLLFVNQKQSNQMVGIQLDAGKFITASTYDTEQNNLSYEFPIDKHDILHLYMDIKKQQIEIKNSKNTNTIKFNKVPIEISTLNLAISRGKVELIYLD